MNEQFKYLFTPIQIGGVTVRNRILITAHGKGYADDDHMPTERYAYYYGERAKGGVGLIVTECMAVHYTAPPVVKEVYAFDKRAIPGLKRIVDAIHDHGGVAFGQGFHAGAMTSGQHWHYPRWAPSALANAAFREIAHEMDHDDIQELVDYYARTAENFAEAGYDGMEIHGGHGHLIEEFMSPAFNKRTDEYGGSLENRMRLGLKVVDAVRAAVGKDMAVGYKISGDEFIEGGLCIEDVKEICKVLESTSKLDYLMITQGSGLTYWGVIPPMDVPHGAFVHLSSAIKEVVDLPVFTVGRVNDPVLAEKILAEGHADMVAMTRACLVDPEMPRKAKEGRLEEIRKCIACVQACRNITIGVPVTCTQNAAVGREKEYGVSLMKPTETRKKIVIVGGGPAGMETARVATMRGHQVVLFEKADELGGQVNLAAKGPSRLEFKEIVRYLSYEMKNLGVKVCLGTEATAESILAEKPDAVVVATGSYPRIPDFPGADGDNLFSYWDVLMETADIGQRVGVVEAGDGFWPTLSAAEFLADAGKDVEIITPVLFVGLDVNKLALPFLYRRLRQKNIATRPTTGVKCIEGNSVTVFDVYSRQETVLEYVDTVVFAYGNIADDRLYKELYGRVKELYRTGDCVAPRRAQHAIRESFELGWRI